MNKNTSGMYGYMFVVIVVLLSCSAYFFAFLSPRLSVDENISTSQQIHPVTLQSSFTKLWLTQQRRKVVTTTFDKLNFGDKAISLIINNTANIESFEAFPPVTGAYVWDLFVPPLSCPDISRIGKIGYGGKWMCGLPHLVNRPNNHPCIIYSFGFGLDLSFEEELSQLANCEIHAFDPNIGGLPEPKIYRNYSDAVLNGKRMITFHKTALGARSGSGREHILMEHIVDIMHRLNHSFIDVLKVNSQGGEWEIFADMFDKSTFSSRSVTLEASSGSTQAAVKTTAAAAGTPARRLKQPVMPVGQLLIELHHSSVPETVKFFKDAEQQGFMSFSREMNMQSCADSGVMDYSLINPDTFFGHRHYTVPAARSLSWHQPVKAVIYFLTQAARVSMMQTALRSLYEMFWKEYSHYPVYLFHDDLTPADRAALQAAVPLMPLTFIVIQFSIPSNLKRQSIPERTECAPKTSTVGYRHMCRFHATGVHELIFAQPELSDVEYIMRLDDDSLLTAPVGYDMFKLMRENKKLYGFVNIAADDAKCITDLWNHTKDFIAEYNSLRRPVRAVNLSHVFFTQLTEPYVFYNNFEISHASIWRNDLWKSYMRYIDRLGGIYTLRWGDAPIHTLAVSLMLHKDQIHGFSDIGYTHFPFALQIRDSLPKPGVDPLLPRYSIFWDNSTDNRTSYQRFSSAGVRLTSLPLRPWQNKHSGVLYSFGHASREIIIAQSINSFFTNYAINSKNPFVIFYSSIGNFNVNMVRDRLNVVKCGANVTFMSVVLPPTADLTESARIMCSYTSDLEVRSATRFLRFSAARLLISMGYSWFFRFGDDSSLLKPVGYNLFDKLASESKRYGFINAARTNPMCGHQQLWQMSKGICDTVSALSQQQPGNSLLKADTLHNCSDMLVKWPDSVSVLSDFEISHRSVWESPACTLLADELGDGTKPTQRHTTVSNIQYDSEYSEFLGGGGAGGGGYHRGNKNKEGRPKKSKNIGRITRALGSVSEHALLLRDEPDERTIWGDSHVHTVCIAMTLRESELHRFDDVDYESKFRPSVVSNATKVEEKPNLTHKFVRQDLSSLDKQFSPRAFGWLGGDVAASVALPNERGPLSLAPTKYIWMFGDTLIGTASLKKRLDGHIISNTIATVQIISRAAPDKSVDYSSSTQKNQLIMRNISKLEYHWTSDDDGTPTAIFELKMSTSVLTTFTAAQKSIYARKPVMWPMTGLVVASARSNRTVASDMLLPHESRMAVLGPLIVSSRPSNSILVDVGLAFEELCTTLVIVDNPYESPANWNYKHAFFPASKYGEFRWVTMAQSQGKSFAALDSEVVYLLGTFSPLTNDHINAHFDIFSLSTESIYQVLGRISMTDLLDQRWSALEVLYTTSAVASNLNENKPRQFWMSVYEITDAHADADSHTPRRRQISRSMSPVKIFGPRVTEASLHYDKLAKLWIIVSLQMYDTHIQMCKAVHIEGPWQCSLAAEVRDPWSKRTEFFTYAGKAHPELVDDDWRVAVGAAGAAPTVVVSIVPNTVNGFAPLFEDQYREAYVPKFIYLQEKQSQVI